MFAPPLKISKPKAASQTIPTRAPDPRRHRPWQSGWGAAEQMRNLPQLIGNQAMLRLLSQLSCPRFLWTPYCSEKLEDRQHGR